MNKDKNRQEPAEDVDNEQTPINEPALESEEQSMETNGKEFELENQITELKDKYLRLAAEFENFKRRTAKERLELIETASKDLMKDLLPVLDDFERAIKASNDEKASKESVKEGVDLIYNKLYTALQSRGLVSLNSQGEAFDTEKHEAITEIPAPDESLKGKVVDVVEKGYQLGEKILRYAKVVVGK